MTDTERTARYPAGVLGIHGSLLSYRYPERGTGNAPRKSGEVDHFPDALRYYVIGRHGVWEQPDIAAMNLMQDGTGAHHGVGYGRDDHSMGDF